jgi:hypothetical protein
MSDMIAESADTIYKRRDRPEARSREPGFLNTILSRSQGELTRALDYDQRHTGEVVQHEKWTRRVPRA